MDSYYFVASLIQNYVNFLKYFIFNANFTFVSKFEMFFRYRKLLARSKFKLYYERRLSSLTC